MKLTIGADRLNQALGQVIGFVPQKPTLPILTNILLETWNYQLRITATNLDTSIVIDTPCEVETEGAVLVHAKRLHGFAREIDSGDVTLTLSADGVLAIEYEGGSLTMQTMPAADFPELQGDEPPKDGVLFPFSGHDLTRLVAAAGYCTAKEQARIALTGVYFELTEGLVTVVSTDGHRLALAKRQARIDKKASAVIPAPALNQAVRLIASGCDLTEIIIGGKAILFRYRGVTLRTKTIDTVYPNYNQVVPKDNPHHATLAVAPFEHIVRRALVVSNAITNMVRLAFTSGQMEASLTNMDTGVEFRESMPVGYDGQPMEIGFNAAFLREMLSKIEADEVGIEMATPTSATIFKPAKLDECEELTYLLMPLRLHD